MRLWFGKTGLLALSTAAFIWVFAGTATAADEFEKYALEEVSASLSNTQAGSHADLTIGFKLTRDKAVEPYALTRDVKAELPPGVIGNPQAVPRCTVAQLGNNAESSVCPFDSQVGVTEVRVREP